VKSSAGPQELGRAVRGEARGLDEKDLGLQTYAALQDAPAHHPLLASPRRAYKRRITVRTVPWATVRGIGHREELVAPRDPLRCTDRQEAPSARRRVERKDKTQTHIRRSILVSVEKGGKRSDSEVREHLANERTMLAWVRTGVGLVSVGLVIERAGALVAAGGGAPGASKAFGLAVAVLGLLALVMGTVQFLRNRRRIRSGDFVPAAASYMVIAAGSMALAGVFIVYTLLS
jgi:putative membrane protein